MIKSGQATIDSLADNKADDSVDTPEKALNKMEPPSSIKKKGVLPSSQGDTKPGEGSKVANSMPYKQSKKENQK